MKSWSWEENEQVCYGRDRRNSRSYPGPWMQQRPKSFPVFTPGWLCNIILSIGCLKLSVIVHKWNYALLNVKTSHSSYKFMSSFLFLFRNNCTYKNNLSQIRQLAQLVQKLQAQRSYLRCQAKTQTFWHKLLGNEDRMQKAKHCSIVTAIYPL